MCEKALIYDMSIQVNKKIKGITLLVHD